MESCGKEISKKEWRKTNIAFLEKHRYFTDYCKTIWNMQKEKPGNDKGKQ
ncbi:MAG: hypothetical protein HC867_02170 [Bacteroidia bacterium]|nr:hypothetical protein [Bacteroidia bacterium]